MKSHRSNPSITLFALAIALIPACTVMRKVEDMVPEIPEIVLIGKKDKPSPTGHLQPGTLEPDLENNAAIFKIDVLGRTERLVIQLFPQDAPLTVANFQNNIRSGHYEGMAIHRVIPNYLVQLGDPQSKQPDTRAAWGTGGLDTTLPAEIKRAHQLGSVGMARLGDAANPQRHSSGSQFYITTGDLSRYDGRYTVFGQVLQGFAALQKLSTLPADENDNPYQRIAILSARLGPAKRYPAESPEILRQRVRRLQVEEMPTTQQDNLPKRLWKKIW